MFEMAVYKATVWRLKGEKREKKLLSYLKNIFSQSPGLKRASPKLIPQKLRTSNYFIKIQYASDF
jgi:hypothetical protein